MIEQAKEILQEAERQGAVGIMVPVNVLRYLIGEVERKDKALKWMLQYEQPKGYEDWDLYQRLIRNTSRQALKEGE